MQPVEIMLHQHQHQKLKSSRVHFEDETDIISYGVEEMPLTLPDGTSFYVSHKKFGEVQATAWISDGSSTEILKQSMTETESKRTHVIEQHTEAIMKIRLAPENERLVAKRELLQLIDEGILKQTVIEKITASPAFKDIDILIFGAICPKIARISVTDAEKRALDKALQQSQTVADPNEQLCWL